MNNTSETSTPRVNLTAFFILTLVISIPIYILAALVPGDMTIFMGLVLTILPITAGLILTYRGNGSDGAKRLLKRSLDFKRITSKRWYLPIFLLFPVIFTLAYFVMFFWGETTPDPLFPVVFTPILFVLFFIFALFEEVGWMGYAFDAMENRWLALNASLILGLIWALWHLPLYILAGQEPLWIVGQIISLLAIRILIVWLYKNTRRSVFATILFHTVYNVCALMFTSFYTSTGHLITSILIVLITLTVVILWDPDTLAQYRFKKK